MKKWIALLLVLAFALSVAGCSSRKGAALLKEGQVERICVTSYPPDDTQTFTGEDVQPIIDYISGLNLRANFPENPDHYAGSSWKISIEYADGETLTIIHFGNMFIRAQGGSWYRMEYEEASRFDNLLYELRSK